MSSVRAVIHQELTIQLSMSPTVGSLSTAISSLPPQPIPGWPGAGGSASKTGWDFVMSPLEVAWPDWPSFYLSSLALLGWGG